MHKAVLLNLTGLEDLSDLVVVITILYTTTETDRYVTMQN